MTAPTAVLDRPSLTLPDWRAALRRKVKRPKRPDRLTLISIGGDTFGALLNIAVGLADHSVGNLVCALALGVDLSVHLRRWWREQPRPPYIVPAQKFAFALWLGSLALIFAGA